METNGHEHDKNVPQFETNSHPKVIKERSNSLNESVDTNEENEQSYNSVSSTNSQIWKDDEQTEETEIHESFCNKIYEQFGGILLTMLASLMSSINLILVKKLQKEGLGPSELTTVGYSGVFIPSIIGVICTQWRIKKQKRRIHSQSIVIQKVQVDTESIFLSVWPWTVSTRRINAVLLLIQSFVGALSILLRFFALSFITVGDTAVISIGAPVIVTILAHFALNEKTGFWSILMAFLSLIGVGIISRPPLLTGQQSFDTQTLIGTSFAFCSTVCAAIQVLIWRKIRGVHFSLQLFVSGAFGVIMGLIAAFAINYKRCGILIFILPKCFAQFFMLCVIGTFGYFVTRAMVTALKIEKAGVVSLVRTNDVLFGFLLQFIFFDVQPDIYSSIGGLIICVGVFVTALRKYVEGIPRGKLIGWKKLLAILCCTQDAMKPDQMYTDNS